MRFLSSVLIGLALSGTAVADPKVEFTGNHGFSSDALRAAITGPQAGRLFDGAGRLDPDIFQRDLLLISAFYWDRGYVDVKVGTPRIEPRVITIPIVEGHVFTVSAVTARGDLAGSAQSNLDKLRTKPGTRFSRSMITADRDTLTTFYQDLGYAWANVDVLTKTDAAHDTLELAFEVKRGPPSRVERILITGNTKTPEAAIRRELAIADGDAFSMTKLMAGKHRVEALGLADVVIAMVKGSAPDRVELHIELTE